MSSCDPPNIKISNLISWLSAQILAHPATKFPNRFVLKIPPDIWQQTRLSRYRSRFRAAHFSGTLYWSFPLLGSACLGGSHCILGLIWINVHCIRYRFTVSVREQCEMANRLDPGIGRESELLACFTRLSYLQDVPGIQAFSFFTRVCGFQVQRFVWNRLTSCYVDFWSVVQY